MQIQKGFNLQQYNTLAVPSVCEFFSAPKTITELKESVLWANENNHNISILGDGSNVLLESEISGLVIRPKLLGIEVLEDTDEYVAVNVGAGENWNEFVLWSLSAGYCGVENLTLIPGAVGAAPVQNIGAYGVELESVFERLNALDLSSGKIKTFSKKECLFGYRESVFKGALNGLFAITEVVLKLQKSQRVHITYPALQHAFSSRDHTQLTPLDVSNTVRSIREQKLPDPKQIPNVGSFFKNPIVSGALFEKIQQQHPGVVAYDVVGPIGEKQKKLAAGWLIEQAGWKGKEYGGAGVHDRQALVLVNPNHCDINVIFALANRIMDAVKKEFGVELQIEPRRIT